MSKWHKEILIPEQVGLLDAIGKFSRDFGLVGGTAIALHIGHRESVDFDLFPKKTDYAFNIAKIQQRFRRQALIEKVLVDEGSEFTFITRTAVKVTFYHFPYHIPYTEGFGSYISMPSLLTLAAMKAFAMGQRNKWKDYVVDLYFIMRDFHPLPEITSKAQDLFKGEFNPKLFREQLSTLTT